VDLFGSAQSIVFVVDDDADVRSGVKQLVESVGLPCEVFASPDECLQRSPATGPSRLILDIRLRELSGIDWLERSGTATVGLQIGSRPRPVDIESTGEC
jgi:FixJ family two-component response regulator